MSKTKRIIQVGGTVRSGTTMLGLIISNAENAISLGEVMHLFDPYNKQHYDKIKELTLDPKWKSIINDKPENLYDNVFKFFPEIDLIIDSSKDPIWFERLSKSSKYNTVQLITYKSPKDLKNSFLKRKMDNWEKVYLNYYKRFFSVFPLVPTVYLKDLLTDEGYLEKLCEYLNIPYSKNRLNYWEKKHPNFFGSSTVKQKKIDSTILEKNDEKINTNGKMYKLFNKLNKKQFINTPIDVNYKYSGFTLKALYFKDNLLKKLNNEK